MILKKQTDLREETNTNLSQGQ